MILIPERLPVAVEIRQIEELIDKLIEFEQFETNVSKQGLEKEIVGAFPSRSLSKRQQC